MHKNTVYKKIFTPVLRSSQSIYRSMLKTKTPTWVFLFPRCCLSLWNKRGERISLTDSLQYVHTQLLLSAFCNTGKKYCQNDFTLTQRKGLTMILSVLSFQNCTSVSTVIINLKVSNIHILYFRLHYTIIFLYFQNRMHYVWSVLYRQSI